MTFLIIVLLAAGIALSVWLERRQARDPFWGRVLSRMEEIRRDRP